MTELKFQARTLRCFCQKKFLNSSTWAGTHSVLNRLGTIIFIVLLIKEKYGSDPYFSLINNTIKISSSAAFLVLKVKDTDCSKYRIFRVLYFSLQYKKKQSCNALLF